MSNRQKATDRRRGRAPRPPGVVHSASHGMTVFGDPAWFRAKKVKPCKDVTCGIASTKKSKHYHPFADVQ